MKTTKWDVNGETIKFNRQYQIIDGQNRFKACISSQKTFRTLITVGIRSDLNVDRGKMRNLAQFLHNEGIKYSTHVAAFLVTYWRDVKSITPFTGGGGSTKPTNEELVELYNNIIDPNRMNNVMSHYGGYKHILTPRVGIYLHYKFSEINQTKSNDFFTRLSDGINLEKDSPILMLRDRLIKLKESKIIQYTDKYKSALVIKAWNYFLFNRKTKNLRYREGQESFPLIGKQPQPNAETTSDSDSDYDFE